MFFKLFLLCDSETKNKGKNNWVCARDVIKSKEVLKVLSSLGIGGTKFISVYNSPAKYCPSFGNQRMLNSEVVAVHVMFVEKVLGKVL